MPKTNPKIRNVIMAISDGFGPASQTFARNYAENLNHKGPAFKLPLDSVLIGTSRTRSSSSLVTDSAAGATAFSCGLKSYNGAIGVDPDGKPCETILELAKRNGLFTGLVSTSRVTHATPAAFGAHVLGRDDESEIAVQEIYGVNGRAIDLIFGGGRCFFIPQSNGGCRLDDRNLWQEAELAGWQIRNGLNFNNTEIALPILHTFAHDHMDYNIDRDDNVQPSLTEMAKKAIQILKSHSEESDTGFFLMVEGSRIDMAAHSNDPATHLHEILEYNNLISMLKDYIDSDPSTVFISTSDHETGGLSLGLQKGKEYPVYQWYPEKLVNVKHSGEYIARKLFSFVGSLKDKREFIAKTVLQDWLGVEDQSNAMVDDLMNCTAPIDIEYKVGSIVSSAAGLGWSTHGHSAVDVNIYGYGSGVEALRGNHENTDIYQFIKNSLGI